MSRFKALNSFEFQVCAFLVEQQCKEGSCCLIGWKKDIFIYFFYLHELMLAQDASRYVTVSDGEAGKE